MSNITNPVGGSTELVANEAHVRQHLKILTKRWPELDEPVQFEIRCLERDSKFPTWEFFKPNEIDQAVEYVANQNIRNNVYVTINPIRIERQGKASSTADVVAAFFVFVDADDTAGMEGIHSFAEPRPMFTVKTGSMPELRGHAYWELEEPCLNLKAWTGLQKSMIRSLNTDPSIHNPDRIMRVAGTVSWPDQNKRAKGYVPEIVIIRTEFDSDSDPVKFEKMCQAFSAVETPITATLDIDLGNQPLDRERARIQALSGKQWNSATFQLVGSYVRQGLTDTEIHSLTAPLTLPGYTVTDTARDVNDMISRTRTKFEKPEQAQPLTPVEASALPDLPFQFWNDIDLTAIPSPQFVYSDFYALGYTSLTVAPPKVGKSMLALAEAIDIATGKGILTGYKREPLRVLYYNAEDDQDVLNSRVSALLTHYQIEQTDIIGTLMPVSGIDHDDFWLISGNDGIINETLFLRLEKLISVNKIDVVIFDPLQDLSRSPETNEIFRAVGQRLRLMATKTQTALSLVHHTRKMQAGQAASIDDARGGSALRGTSRFNRMLIGMTADEGVKAGVENHRYYFRIADVESNLAPPSASVNQWFEKISVITPSGQSVGAVREWEWPDAFDGISKKDASSVRTAIAAMAANPPQESAKGKHWVGYKVAEVLGLNINEKAINAKIKQMLKHWIKEDVLAVVERQNRRSGRLSKYVVAGSNNPNITETIG